MKMAIAMMVLGVSLMMFSVVTLMDALERYEQKQEGRALICLEQFKVSIHDKINGQLYCKVGDLWEKASD